MQVYLSTLFFVHFRASSEGSETKGDSRVSVSSQYFCVIVSNTLYLQVTFRIVNVVVTKTILLDVQATYNISI